MSKHEKHVRRGRKKTDRPRRRRSLFNPQSAIRNPKSGAMALAAAAAIASGTAAYASPVRFDNPPGPGHFEWYSGVAGSDIWLDIALPAASQPDLPSPTGAWQVVQADLSQVLGAPGEMEFQVGGYANLFLVGVNSGDLIPSGYPWLGDPFISTTTPGFEGELPEGVATYLGVRFDLGGGDQYGWIGVERTGLSLDAFAWGYETEAGVPIAAGAPEPGTLALLAFGALAATRRQRRA